MTRAQDTTPQAEDPGFSLIIPTLGRNRELRRLLLSFQKSTFRNFEVIIVDQNRDGLIDDVCREFAGSFPLRQLKVELTGVARARNYGLPFARHEWINFPDDDCEFTPELLAEVARRFAAQPGLDALFARAVDPASRESSVTKFSTQSQWVSPRNVFFTTVEFTMFIKKSVMTEVGPLDEQLGVGTFYGAEEGSDFVLRALAKQKRLFYDPALLIFHEQKVARYDAAEQARAYNYGKGFGRMSVKHLWLHREPGAAIRFVHFQGRALCAAVLYLCLFQPDRSKYYRKSFQGRMVGAWRSWPEFRKTKTRPAS